MSAPGLRGKNSNNSNEVRKEKSEVQRTTLGQGTIWATPRGNMGQLGQLETDLEALKCLESKGLCWIFHVFLYQSPEDT